MRCRNSDSFTNRAVYLLFTAEWWKSNSLSTFTYQWAIRKQQLERFRFMRGGSIFVEKRPLIQAILRYSYLINYS